MRLFDGFDRFKPIGYIILPFIVAILLYIVPSGPSERTSFEGWYMHAYQYKYPELETYIHVDDGKWTLLIEGEIVAQGKYVEQHEEELYKQADPWKDQQYKYDFISEKGVPYSCFFKIEHGWKEASRGKIRLEYKNEADRKSPEQQERWESFLCSEFVRIKEPKV